MIKTIDERMTEAIKNSKKEQVEFFVEGLQKNLSLSNSRAMKSLIFCFIAFFLWLVINSALINKLSFLGMEFVNLDRMLPIIPPIAAFFYYNYISQFIFSEIIDTVLRSYYSQELKSFHEGYLTELLEPSTILKNEIAFYNLLLEKERSDLWFRITGAWGYILVIIMLFIPLILISWMAYSLFTLIVVSIWWSILSFIVVFILVIRSLLLFYIYSTQF